MENEIIKHVNNIWNYHNIKNELKKVDFILVMGSADDRVAIHAAYLYLLNYSDTIVTSGGFGKVTKNTHAIAEGDRFAKIIEKMNVPSTKIIIENEATNSGENLTFSRKKLLDLNHNFKSGILVTKPYMKRRAYATAKKQWPEIDWIISAPDLSLECYVNELITFELTVNLMVGDLQRIKLFAKNGLQIKQHIPKSVWESYEFLKKNGFDKYVIK